MPLIRGGRLVHIGVAPRRLPPNPRGALWGITQRASAPGAHRKQHEADQPVALVDRLLPRSRARDPRILLHTPRPAGHHRATACSRHGEPGPPGSTKLSSRTDLVGVASESSRAVPRDDVKRASRIQFLKMAGKGIPQPPILTESGHDDCLDQFPGVTWLVSLCKTTGWLQ